CRQHSATTLRVASLLPVLEVSVAGQETLAPGLTRIDLVVRNSGYLGTHGINSAKKLSHVEPLRLTVEGDGVELALPTDAVTQIGHLEGWGRGPHGGFQIFAPWTRGNEGERRVS